MQKDYQFMAEYAKSNRSSCKSCKESIPKDSLRMAIMIQSPKFDGKIPMWYHFKCFFKKSKIKSAEDVQFIEMLRWEDQEKIKQNITSGTDSSEVVGFTIDYAKSKRSNCVKCEVSIVKNDIRISHKDFESEKGRLLGGIDRWYHIECFLKIKTDILKSCIDFDISKISGFNKLKLPDQEAIIEKFKSWKSKKRPASNVSKGSEKPSKVAKESNDNELKLQNQLLWDMRDKLSKQVAKASLSDMLTINSQHVPIGESALLNTLADRMVFGRLNKCPECGGQLEFTSNKYGCQSMINEWTRCVYETRDVKRTPMKIPDEFTEVSVFNEYKYVERKRILPDDSASSSQLSTKPLEGYTIVIDKVKFSGELNRQELEKVVRNFDGKIKSKIDSNVLAFISTKDGIDNNDELQQNLKSNNINVVSTSFLTDISNNMSLTNALKKNSIVDWGRDLDSINRLRVKASTKERNYTDVEVKQKFKAIGGAAVDPDSELEDKAHVYLDPVTKDPFNVVLGMVDIVRGSNSFYKLQLLESNKKKKWWVFRSWGRIGTTIGSNKIENFGDLYEATDSFEEVYFDKTGNQWSSRHKFKKQPGKFNPIDIDYGEAIETVKNDTNSNLHPQLQILIRFIFDIESMKQAMLEFELDLKKMPLGKLSKNQVHLAYEVLTELQTILTESEPSKTKILDASTRFYTLLPHDFGMRRPPLIDSLNALKSKTEMLENLLEIEVAYKLMVTGEANSIDCYYEKLRSSITCLDKSSDKFKRIKTYLKNTHGATHTGYTLKIDDIFEVCREGENERFEPYKKFSNRMMLWHGSRRTNWAGILSQGLRIAPPEAPATGYMFGKGIYFADMVSKSANYCHVLPNSSEGILLLCEVALGNVTERFNADEKIRLKSGEHSCKGVGQTMPDPNGNFVDEDGVVYPMGKSVSNKAYRAGSLLYNEYIVYDIAQVRQRFLLKVRFEYGRSKR